VGGLVLGLGLALGLGALGVATSGCGILSSDIASISFDLPARHYVFDTAAWKLPAGTLPTIPCTSSDMCCTLAQQLVGYDCATNPALTCDTTASPSSCAVSIPVETPPQTIDLKMQVPELSSFGSSQSLANVSISQIKYDVTSTLNRELPPVDLFLAPAGVTSTSDPQAHRFGTVPATPAATQNGTTIVPTTITGATVMLDPDAGATFASYAYHFGTPFEFLGRATVVIRGGDSTPTGSVDITVSGKVTAKPNL
jgi:hypothetical protein